MAIANPNKVTRDIGDLGQLKTGAKNDLVSAINELQVGGGSGTYDSAYITTTQTLADNSELTSPLQYQVGNGSLLVFCLGEKLIKVEDGKDGHYEEVGVAGTMSTKIRLHNINMSVPAGTTFEFMVPAGYN